MGTRFASGSDTDKAVRVAVWLITAAVLTTPYYGWLPVLVIGGSIVAGGYVVRKLR